VGQDCGKAAFESICEVVRTKCKWNPSHMICVSATSMLEQLNVTIHGTE